MTRPHRYGVPGLALGVLVCLSAFPEARPPIQGEPPSTIPVEVVALERDGTFADSLKPESFAVAVDGRPRRVLWVRQVSRGPGSMAEAGRHQPAGADPVRYAAEPARSILIVVDQSSIERGSERTVIEAAGSLVDRFGLDDRIGVIRIPVARAGRVDLTTERVAVRAELRLLAGLAPRAASQPSNAPAVTLLVPASDPNEPTGDPAASNSPERPQIDTDRLGAANEGLPAADYVTSLRDLVTALRPFPTRKVLAVFSGGLRTGGTERIDDLARQAIAAHTTIYAFRISDGHDSRAEAPGLSALARLATSTGGSLLVVGKGTDKGIERMVSDISACYVLGVESSSTDADGRAHALRVEALRPQVTIRAPAWFVPRPDLVDVMPSSAEAGSAASAPPRRGKDTGAVPVRDVEAQRLIARATSYVAGYERQYSMLVAEETLVQSVRSREHAIRSDLLLVRPFGTEGWMSFRDVFEVEGTAVRDRDDWLRRLFLDPSLEARAQLERIAAESARYNVGDVERNINVPLLALKFLRPDNVGRFRFKVLGKETVGGVSAVRVSYDEQARPTLVHLNKVEDVPATGWFLVDAASGAVMASRIGFELHAGSIELEVRYTRDAALGMWVPAEMTEVHWADPPNGTQGRITSMEARATYSNFRRFQVTTDEQINEIAEVAPSAWPPAPSRILPFPGGSHGSRRHPSTRAARPWRESPRVHHDGRHRRHRRGGGSRPRVGGAGRGAGRDGQGRRREHHHAHGQRPHAEDARRGALVAAATSCAITSA